jgi:DNA-binding NarL/FixJ family response regulator
MTDRVRDIRVLVADDEALVRAGFMILVDSAPGLSVVGQASDGVQAVRQARALKPDVVLMDIRMPVMGGLEATKLILDGDQDPPPRILVVTTFDEDEHVFEALRSGASGFVLKDTPPEKLLDAITIVAAGEALLAPAITRRLIAEFARRPRAAAPSAGDVLAPLTEREREVLQQVAAGGSNAEVAAALHLSVATVKTHISRLLSKLDCRDRAQLVVVAYETGVAIPGLRLAPPRPGRKMTGIRPAASLRSDPCRAISQSTCPLPATPALTSSATSRAPFRSAGWSCAGCRS